MRKLPWKFFYKKVGVYKIENLINHKVYIGHSVNLYERSARHLGDLLKNKHPNKHLQSAWNKYGGDNFIFECIIMCTREHMQRFEQLLLDYWMPLGMAYNKLDAAAKPPINTRTKQVDCYTLVGKFVRSFDSMTEAYKFFGKNGSGRITKSCDDGRYTALGYRWTHLGEKLEIIPNPVNNNTTGKKIYCINNHGGRTEFNSVAEAAREFNVTTTSIFRLCNGGSSRIVEGVWGYVGCEPVFKKNKLIKKVKCYNLDGSFVKIFDSMVEAARFSGVKHQASITYACQKGMRAGKYRWEYA